MSVWATKAERGGVGGWVVRAWILHLAVQYDHSTHTLPLPLPSSTIQVSGCLHHSIIPALDPAISSISVWFQQEAGAGQSRRLPLSWDFRSHKLTHSNLQHKGHSGLSPSLTLIVHHARWFTFNSGGYFSCPRGREALKACLEGMWIMHLRDSSPEARQEPYFS